MTEIEYRSYLTAVGFNSDPFEHTNADQEPQLDAYFVPPPYFESVLGDPSAPKSQVVLAPRGGGKSAQRRMIELESVKTSKSFLCITHDLFDVSVEEDLAKVDLAFHLRRLNQLMLIAILAILEGDQTRARLLDQHQRKNIALLAATYLDNMTASEFKSGLASVKTLGHRAQELWTKFGTGAKALIAFGLKLMGVPAQAPVALPAGRELAAATSLHFRELIPVVQGLGFFATYFLIDKIDETAVTNDAASAFRLIKPLVLDLPTLEVKGSAFKFFLWDVIEPHYTKAGARADRVPLYKLKWNREELGEMLRRRMTALSDNRIQSFNQLCDPAIGFDVHRLLPHFAEGSPRDVIRLAKRIVAEHTKTGHRTDSISLKSIEKGLKLFSDERATELYRESVQEMRKVARPAFTINELANDVFRISTQAARAKVQAWMDEGHVKKIGEIPNKKNRPLHLYGVRDPRLVAAMLPQSSIIDLIRSNMFVCDVCGGLSFLEGERVHCTSCDHECASGAATSVLSSCSRSQQ